ncbi:MAG: class IV adenylate cyclase [Patescibacteria group bacterium]|nr:class IV adenylate cyclase [Patescibacteria group bacterium]MDE2015727.1 class IV adenylate cyclase [Patescibacteria group bacterium]MDE2226784.1 class IV adenylate cyclase [Patescibacteria group bacterium]
MKTEIEAKFLDINPAAIRGELQKLGASLIRPESATRQKVFDYPDFRLDKDISWLRLRDESGIVTLTLKKWEKEGVHGMKEIEVEVTSFEETERLLLAIGLLVKSSQTKKRELWKFGNTEFMIDTWPWIPTFLEIEGESEDDVRAAATRLNLNWQTALFGGVAIAYKQYFNIKYEEIDRCPEIEFSPIPEWLEKKRISK